MSNKMKQYATDMKQCMHEIKENPNSFPIINKWNMRIFNKKKFEAFDIISKALDEAMGTKYD